MRDVDWAIATWNIRDMNENPEPDCRPMNWVVGSEREIANVAAEGGTAIADPLTGIPLGAEPEAAPSSVSGAPSRHGRVCHCITFFVATTGCDTGLP